MGLYETVLNRATIYDCFFLKVNSVLEYKNLNLLKERKSSLHDTWVSLSSEHAKKQSMTDNEYYQRYAPHYPEYSKVVGVTFGDVEFKDGKMNKNLKRIINFDEEIVLERFFDVLYMLSSDSLNTSPMALKTLTGFNIIYNDIPLLVKRFFINREKFKEKKEIPLILKKTLDLKPWENEAIIDLANVWNFKGRNIYSLDLISDFLNLEKKEEILTAHDLSKKFWDEIDATPDDKINALKLIARQGAVTVNLIIKIINTLRTF
jgi:hypothetical protein